ncbi:MAG: pilus assembly protein [Gammaproteobacteria bacterium]|nr:pilus assembly protein [Gammaproteobacteria bacterium]
MTVSIILIILLFFTRISLATNYNFSNTPLFLASNTQPNIFFELDDSGSMDWEILTRPHWHYCAYDPDAGSYNNASDSCGWLVENGLIRIYTGSSFQNFEYIFDNTDDAYSNSCNNSRQTAEMCNDSDINQEWRLKSSALNVTYYNPSITYKPWIGTGMSDASFSQARSDPEPTSSGYSDIRNLDGFVYHIWEDSHGWNSNNSQPLRGSNNNRTSGANGLVDLWDNHVRYTINSTSIQVDNISYNPTSTSMGETISSSILTGSMTDIYGRTISEIKTNIANWYQYHRKRSYVAKGAVASVINNSPSFRYGLSVINQENNLFKEVPDSALTPPYSSHNTEIISDLFKFDWPASSTPLRRGLELVGRYFDHDLSINPDTGAAMDDPILDSCQQNFTVLFTDGYWNGGDPNSAIADADGDGINLTIADVAKYYYDLDLSPLINEVVPNIYDSAEHQHMVTFTVAFGVSGLLTDSSSNGWPNNADGSDKTESDDWGSPFCSDCPEKIDDLWHSAFNSKGTFVSASTPEDVVKSLNDAINNVADRTSSAASVALNSGTLISDTFLFQARFDSATWEGEVLAYPIQSDGSVANVSWNAGEQLALKSHANREIISYNGNQGIAFRWPGNYLSPSISEFSSTQISELLNDKPSIISSSNETQVYGQKIINYFRGDNTYQGTTEIPRTNRMGKLGDIIHSAPSFVASPGFRYVGNWGDLSQLSGSATDTTEPEDNASYNDYKLAYANRSAMIYVGANDGMMHGFFAEESVRNGHQPGEELIAYVPAQVFESLPNILQEPYVHQYTVDGSITVGDVFYDASWHTVLLGALRSGGQAVYALDVTDPDNFSELNAADIVLWEFTDTDDSDMGYSFSQPAIARMHNGEWAAIFGNGYNNTQSDNHISSGSTEGQAVLYIVNIKTGDLIKKIETKVGLNSAQSTGHPNGLSTPAPIDIDGDHIVDLIYAGDLYGNLWKFDVRESNVNQWDIAYSSGSSYLPIFSAISSTNDRQAITSRPEISYHPSGNGFLVYFGTGKYFENSDNSSSGQHTESFYSIWDKDQNSLINFSRNDLLKQEILQEVLGNYDTDGDDNADTSYNLRQTTRHKIVWHNYSGTPSSDPLLDSEANIIETHLGWYLDLVNTENGTNTNNYGEKLVSNPILRNGHIIFSTLLPSVSSCSFGGDSWLMELDAYTGSALAYSPFDLDADNDFDSFDYANIGDPDGDGEDEFVPPSGKKSKNGINSTPGVISAGSIEYKYTSGSSGQIEKTTENPGVSNFGRQSWLEIK